MKIVDLFSGCGGFSLGFELAGFETMCAIEFDLWASETYAFNHPKAKVINDDIRNVKSLKPLVKKDVDGVIGGPPCQGFSLSGSRDPKDPRNSLFMDFVRIVKELKPKFFVMENVPGILSMRTKGGDYVKNIIRSEFEKAHYKVCIHILNAANYGVPQARERVFFIGVRSEFPLASSKIAPPIVLSSADQVSIWDAISDLPVLSAGQGSEMQEYPGLPETPYQKWARSGMTEVHNHVAMRHTPRLVERFKQIGYGQSVKDVPAEHSQRKRGDAASISGKVFSQNNMRPYPDRPSPTVAASFQSNFIHPYQDRNYTAREGARLQSFPDYYIFKGKRTTMSWEKHLSQYQQIGNAVPPLMAKAIATRIHWYFSNVDSLKDDPESSGIDRQIALI